MHPDAISRVKSGKYANAVAVDNIMPVLSVNQIPPKTTKQSKAYKKPLKSAIPAKRQNESTTNLNSQKVQ